MDVSGLLTDAFTRMREQVPAILDGLGEEALTWRPGPDANTIAWMVWHLTRVQDEHIADAAAAEAAWVASGWHERFGLPFPAEAHGYGQTPDEVGQVSGISANLLAGYYDEVAGQSLAYLATLTPEDMDRVVDTRWDPPVTLGVRLVSVLEDLYAHVGQAAYVRGMWERRSDRDQTA